MDYFKISSNDSRKIKIVNDVLESLIDGCSEATNNKTIRHRCELPSKEGISFIKIPNCEMDRIFHA